jgi:hypothetical protein
MLRVLGLALLTLTACTDRLTAPEAQAILDAVEQPLGSREMSRRLWERMGWADGLMRLHTSSRVLVRRDGRELAYAGVVFERLMVPASGSRRSPCLGPRWSLFLWRGDEHPEGLSLTGGRFDRALSSGGGMCPDVDFIDPAPFAAWYPPEGPGDRGGGWVSAAGRGEITPGVDVGPCDFLAAADAEELYRSIGVTCRVTRHRVYLRSTLHPVATDGGLDRWGGTMEVQVAPVEVLGVRYTIECGLPQAAFMCRRLRNPSDGA